MPARSRPRIALAAILVIALGLLSRSGLPALPQWFKGHAGDALWTTTAYLALAFARPAASDVLLLGSAFGISVAIELTQLAHPPWLEELRRTLPGRVLLGSDWCWADLPRYAAGALLAWGLDRTGLLRGKG